jgi:hypothetical protein
METYIVRNAWADGRYEIRDSHTRELVACGETPPVNIDELLNQYCKVCGGYFCTIHGNWIACSCPGNWKYDLAVHLKCPGCGAPPLNLSANQNRETHRNIRSLYGWSSDPVTDAELQAKYGDSIPQAEGGSVSAMENLHPNPGALRAIVCRDGALCKKVTWTRNPTPGGMDAALSAKIVDEANPECGPHRVILYEAVGIQTNSGYVIEERFKKAMGSV